MMPERWHRIEQLYHAALERDEDRRAAYLREACAGDDALCREVESLLAQATDGDQFLETPALHLAAKMLAENGTPSYLPGQQLGSYTILSLLGAGGMGVVYRARDAKLGREVAVKILPEAFDRDAARMARFEREAKILASLNHPNIGSIYGLEDSDKTCALVMELVEGPTLAERIKAGPIPLEEALPIAKQICEALECAHERGVVHRDLKPANVKLASGNTVKVLDFGLAKAMESELPATEAGKSPAIATEAGVLLGTAAYMSPEQAKGKAVDRRADIWAFGCVLYEMLTGRMAFCCETTADTLAAVLTNEPDWSQLAAAAPQQVRVLLRRCLQKDARQRLRDIGDARILLEEVLLGAAEETRSAVATSRRSWLVGIVAALLASTAAWLAFFHFRTEPSSPREPLRFEIPAPTGVTLSFLGSFAISPDGRQLAFAAKGSDGVLRLWIRPLNSLEAHPVLGSESPVNDPFFWSPDSRFIAFGAGGKLKKIDVTGGQPQTLCDTAEDITGGSWNRNGVLIFGQQSGGGLMRVSTDGGTASPLTTLDASRGEVLHGFPSFLPDGRHFIYFSLSTNHANTGTYVGSLDANPGEHNAKQLVATDYQSAYGPLPNSDTGHLLFVRDGTLFAQPFDALRLELMGEPVTVVEQVGTFSSYPYFSASTNGVLIYKTGGGPAQETQLAWYDRQGKLMGKVGEPGLFLQFALSPDGTRVGVHSIDPQHPASIILLVDLSRGTTTRFTFGPFMAYSSAWSRDGSRIIFVSSHAGRYGLYEKPVNGEKEEQLLLQSDENMVATSWSRDGRFLLYFTIDSKNSNDLWVLPLEGEKKPIPFLRTEFNEAHGYFSPDGHWVAYDSDETGREEVYVRPFSTDSTAEASAAGPKWLISTAGGVEPRWRADGRELYYVALDGKLMAVDVATGQAFQAGVPRALFQTPVAHREFGVIGVPEVTADGKRFLFEVPADQLAQPPFIVVQNWQTELK
jgi:eukaryotic-like serine/threonine-protein kinase